MGAVNLDIFVSEIATVIASFDVIRVQRSVSGDAGPWENLTTAAATKATLLGSLTGPFMASALTLNLKRDSQPDSAVTFTGTNPITTSLIASQINTAVGAVIATDVANALQLQSALLGTASKMAVLSGSAMAVLGLTAARDIGSEAYIALVLGTDAYDFTDNDGAANYFYRVSYFNTITLIESPWSTPFQGAPGMMVDGDALSLATIDLVDAAGVAVAGVRVHFYSMGQALQSGNFHVALDRGPRTIVTDNSGHAELSLVRGLHLKVVVEGIGIVREIVVPDATEFDVLGAVAAAPDPFAVAVLNLPSAIRRSI